MLVEYDDVEWHRREWISIYKEGLFHLFLVEQGLSWADRKDPYSPTQTKVLWPAIVSILFILYLLYYSCIINYMFITMKKKYDKYI